MLENTTNQTEAVIKPQPSRVHAILAHSYIFYFMAFLLGLFFDSLFPYKIFSSFNSIPIGILFLLFATLLIFWAQKTSRNLKIEEVTKESFLKGPYSYTRNPTHWGLFFLMLGFGILVNTLFVIIFTVIAFFVTKFIFLRKQELVLEKKYGTPYLEYKKSVWL